MSLSGKRNVKRDFILFSSFNNHFFKEKNTYLQHVSQDPDMKECCHAKKELEVVFCFCFVGVSRHVIKKYY